MNALTCHEAEALLDLYAADACAAAETEAVTAHLATCAACGAALEEACTLQALLDWQAREPQARRRLGDRLAALTRQERVRRREPASLLRRIGSLAALLLVAVGVVGWLGRVVVAPTDRRGDETVVASLTVRPPDAERVFPPDVPEMVRSKEGELRIVTDMQQKTESLAGASRAVELHNDSGHSTLLRITVESGAVIATPSMLRLAPGETKRIVLRPDSSAEALDLRFPKTEETSVRLRVEEEFEPTRGDPVRRREVLLTLPPVRK